MEGQISSANLDLSPGHGPGTALSAFDKLTHIILQPP